MWLYYLTVTTCIPLILGGLFWQRSRRITFKEWAKGALLSFGVSGGFYGYAVLYHTNGVETAGFDSTLPLIMLVVQAIFWTAAFSNTERRAASTPAEEEEDRPKQQLADEKAAAQLLESVGVDDIGDAGKLLAVMVNEDPERVDAYTAMKAAYFLAKLNDRACVSALAELLVNDAEATRDSAAYALNGMKIPQNASEFQNCIPFFIEKLIQTPEKRRKHVIRVLELVDPQWHQCEAAQALVKDLTKAFDGTTGSVLQRLYHLEAGEELLGLYDSCDLARKKKALVYIGGLQVAGGISLCLDLLQDKDLKGYALSSLNAYGFRRASPSVTTRCSGVVGPVNSPRSVSYSRACP